MRFKFCLSVLILFSLHCKGEWTPADSLRNMINSGNKDSLKIALFVNYSYTYYTQPEIVLALISEITNYSDKIADEKMRALCLRKIGVIYGKQNYFDKALEYTIKSANLFEKINDREGLSNCYNNIGNFYNSKGDLTKDNLFFDRSIEYHLKCIKLRTEINDTSQLRNSYNNIGNAYKSKQDYKKALEYYDKCYIIYKRSGDNNGIAMISLNLGGVYLDMALKEKNNDYYKRSLSYFQYLLDDVKKNGLSVDRQAEALSKKGRILYETGNVAEGIDFLLEGFRLSTQVRDKTLILDAAEQLVAAYEKKGDYKQADEFLHVYNSIKDSLLNEKNRHSVEQMQALYQSSQKDREIEKLNTDREIQEAKLYRKNVYIGSTIGGILIIMILGFVLLSRYNLKKKANLQLTDAYGKIETKNRQITDSINYSKRIQNAILPPTELINKHLKNFFLFYAPKDIVSGDFYWFSETDQHTFFIVADCTGHGVPGALMSMIGNTLLNETINQNNITDPGEILSHLNNGVMHALHQQDNDLNTQDDGMDISICCIEKKKSNVLKYATANHSIFIKNKNTVTELTGDIYSIGGSMAISDKHFASKEYKLEEGSFVIMSTDGYYDQFGGPGDSKFLVTNFEEWIRKTDMHSANPGEELKQAHNNWKGARRQTDDILVAGFKV